jgi:hypothetical protein
VGIIIMNTYKEKTKDDVTPELYVKPVTRNDQLVSGFKKFCRNNPEVWDLYQHYTFEIIGAGFSNYSADVLGRIRWHSNLKTKGSSVKINSCYSAYYSRLFMMEYPQYEGFFRTRKLRSKSNSMMMAMFSLLRKIVQKKI